MILLKCLVCKKEIPKKTYESKKRYSKRKFCSTDCSYLYMKEEKIGWWSDEKEEAQQYEGDKIRVF